MQQVSGPLISRDGRWALKSLKCTVTLTIRWAQAVPALNINKLPDPYPIENRIPQARETTIEHRENGPGKILACVRAVNISVPYPIPDIGFLSLRRI